MKTNHDPITILEALRDKLTQASNGLDVAGDSASSSWMEGMAEDIRLALEALRAPVNSEDVTAAEALLVHLSRATCACDQSVGVVCEACAAAAALVAFRKLAAYWRDREDRAFEAMIAFALRPDPPDPNPMTAEDVDEANLPELTDEEKAAVNSIDIEKIIAKGMERPTDSAIEAAAAVYDRIVGEATTMGHIPHDDPLGDPNTFGVRVKAGEFVRIVARAIDAARCLPLSCEHVQRLALKLAKVLIRVGVLRDDVGSTGPDIECAADTYLEKPTVPTLAWAADQIESLLQGQFLEMTKAKDAGTLAMAIDAVGTRLDRLIIEIRCPVGHEPSCPRLQFSDAGEIEAPCLCKGRDEPAGAVKCSGGPEHLPECGGTCGDLKPTEAEIEYTALDWGEYQERINASLAKCAEADHKAEMIDTIMAAGMLAVSSKGGAMIALAELFATMIPDGEPLSEIPEGWAPVALAINPATGEFVTLAGPRSAPDGRVEALETMLAKWGNDSIRHTLGAVRDAGRRTLAPKSDGEAMEPCPRRRESGAYQSDEVDRWATNRWKGGGDWRLEWFPRSCSFCGSVHPDDAMRLIEEGWEPEVASGKRYKIYLHPPGYCDRMRATIKGIREKGVEGMVDGWSPTPPVKAYTPHLSQEQIDRVNERVRQLKEDDGESEV